MDETERRRRISETKRNYYIRNRDKIRAAQAEYYEANRETRREAMRDYYINTREDRLAYEKIRGTERRAAFRKLVQELATAQGGLCPCGELLGDDLNLDHDRSCCDKDVRNSCRRCDRAVMHRTCNSIIGFAKDDPGKLRNLADFLEDTKITQ